MMYDWLSTSAELGAANVNTAIVPLGSIEQHGSHLPLGTDFVIANAIAKKVAEALDAYLLPGIPVGTCQEHTGGKGSVWVSPSTYFNVIQDICLSLRTEGFRRIAFIMGHGGLWIVKPAVRQMNLSYPDITVLHIVPGDAFRQHIARILDNASVDIHAGEGETSLMLHLTPEHVHMEKAVDSVPGVGREFFDYLPLLKFSPAGTWGTPTKATKEKGAKTLEVLAELTAKYLRETFEKVEKFKKCQ